MTPNEIPQEFKIANVAKAFFEKFEWPFDVEERRSASRLMFTSHTYIDNQTYMVVIETDEKKETIEFFMYSPFRVHPARVRDVIVVLNRINIGQRLGRFAIWDDADSNAIQWKGAIDVEGSEFSVAQIDTLCSAGFSTFRRHFDLLSSIALTQVPADEAWKSFLEASKREQRNDLEGVPAEL